VFGQQLVEVIAGHAARDAWIACADQIAVAIAQRQELRIDFSLSTGFAQKRAEIARARGAHGHLGSVVEQDVQLVDVVHGLAGETHGDRAVVRGIARVQRAAAAVKAHLALDGAFQLVFKVAGGTAGVAGSAHRASVGSTGLPVGARTFIAALTPPSRCGTPATLRPSSTPPSVPMSIRSLKAPRCPMRNTLPLSRPNPVPRDMSNLSTMISRSLSASWPSGVNTAVSELEYSSGSSQA